MSVKNKNSENIYLFIIWSSALWCRNKIIKDIEKTFEIKLNVFVKWDKDKIGDNLEAFYGSKMDSIKEKIKSTGTKPFNVIVINDNNPKYELRKVHNENTLVNSNVFDKKELYRKWTAQNFRIHSSIENEESMHDLTVLFGKDYLKNFDKYQENEIIHLNTKAVEGFESKNDLIECLKLFGNNIAYEANEITYIFCKKKLDVLRFIKLKMEIVVYLYMVKMKAICLLILLKMQKRITRLSRY